QSSSAWLFRLPPEGVNLEDVERQLVVQALERSSWNQTHAGLLLRINRDQVRYRIEKFGLRSSNGAHDRASTARERVPGVNVVRAPASAVASAP
ncbi:helix-turn-helix domain-containing protein, partial [Escherichia coli]|uniref:helix-turn-helix domain-containing protein n=1 Tax=Escherichia coli TaxID=562 RepID=UPI0019318B1D